MTDPVIVRMRHIRKVKMCSAGARAFAERHGLDWNAFVSDGLPEGVLIATGDADAMLVVQAARDGQ
jgi:hypothetical protein